MRLEMVLEIHALAPPEKFKKVAVRMMIAGIEIGGVATEIEIEKAEIIETIEIVIVTIEIIAIEIVTEITIADVDQGQIREGETEIATETGADSSILTLNFTHFINFSKCGNKCLF